MTSNEIIEQLKPITDRKWWCPYCDRFLEPNEVYYASMSRASYCTHHHSNDLSIQTTMNAYNKIVDDLVEQIKYEQSPDQSSG